MFESSLVNDCPSPMSMLELQPIALGESAITKPGDPLGVPDVMAFRWIDEADGVGEGPATDEETLRESLAVDCGDLPTNILILLSNPVLSQRIIDFWKK